MDTAISKVHTPTEHCKLYTTNCTEKVVYYKLLTEAVHYKLPTTCIIFSFFKFHLFNEKAEMPGEDINRFMYT